MWNDSDIPATFPLFGMPHAPAELMNVLVPCPLMPGPMGPATAIAAARPRVSMSRHTAIGRYTVARSVAAFVAPPFEPAVRAAWAMNDLTSTLHVCRGIFAYKPLASTRCSTTDRVVGCASATVASAPAAAQIVASFATFVGIFIRLLRRLKEASISKGREATDVPRTSAVRSPISTERGDESQRRGMAPGPCRFAVAREHPSVHATT